MKRQLVAIAVTAIAMAAGTGPALAEPGQTATDSTGTVQVAQPGLTADGSVEAPVGADPNEGITADPQADITAQLTPAQGGDQLADNSTATIQVGGGGRQTATDSTGTVQVAQASMDADAQAQAPTTADLNDGVDSRPEADLTIQSQPAEGGDQMADNSTATIQVGGGGQQTATDSAGTVQVAEPGLTADGSVEAPVGADPNEGITADPQADITAQLTPAQGGDQLADNSTATIQVGGGGQQTATDSTGTVQVAGPGPERELASVHSPTAAPPAEQAPTPEAEPSPAPSPRVLGARTIRGPAQPSRPAALGVRTEKPLSQPPRLQTLPFTGLVLWVSVLLGAALLLAGLGLRRRWVPGLTA